MPSIEIAVIKRYYTNFLGQLHSLKLAPTLVLKSSYDQCSELVTEIVLVFHISKLSFVNGHFGVVSLPDPL